MVDLAKIDYTDFMGFLIRSSLSTWSLFVSLSFVATACGDDEGDEGADPNGDSAVACSSGDTYFESDGVVIIEPETCLDAFRTGDSFSVVTESVEVDQGQDQGRMLTETLLLTGSNHLGNLDGELITFPIRITNPGVYRLHVRSVFGGSSNTDENDGWFRVRNTESTHYFCVEGGELGGSSDFRELLDSGGERNGQTLHYPEGNALDRPDFGRENPGRGGFFKIFRAGRNQTNRWSASTIDNNGYPVYLFAPEAGVYELELRERSAGWRLDRIALLHIDLAGAGLPFDTLDGAESELGRVE